MRVMCPDILSFINAPTLKMIVMPTSVIAIVMQCSNHLGFHRLKLIKRRKIVRVRVALTMA